MIAMSEKLATGALDDLGFQFAPQVVVSTALKAGIFTAIVNGAKGVGNIAAATECSERGIGMVLNCLAAMGLLEKENERYELNQISRNYLLPSSENYLGPLFLCCDRMLRLWLTLPEAVRTGKPTLSIFTEEEKEKFNLDTVDALFQVHKPYAWRLAEFLTRDVSLNLGEESAIKILDVAAGSAVWSIPLALRLKKAEVTAVDLVPVLDVARKYARQSEVEERYRFIGGDIRVIDFGGDGYDLVLLGHICHSEGAQWSRGLIGKCFRALRQKGRLLIMDYLPDEERESGLSPALMAVHALLGTDEGDTFSFSQYEKWLLEAGFIDAQRIKVNDHSPIIMGLKG